VKEAKHPTNHGIQGVNGERGRSKRALEYRGAQKAEYKKRRKAVGVGVISCFLWFLWFACDLLYIL